MTSFTIDELSIPETVDAPGAVDFAETVLVHNESEAAAIGLDLGYTLAESLPSWHDPYVSQRLLAARVDGKIVGRATLNVAQDAEDAEAWFEIDVLPQYRERGIGTALYTRITEFALADGRTVLEADVLHSNSPGARLTAATGHGSVPRESPETRFLLERGFTLEQVERMGKLPLPVDQGALDSHFTTANRAAGSEYRIHEWSGSTPENWLTDLAMLHARMSTDAPAANLTVSAETWDEKRLRMLEHNERASPRTALLAVVEHVPTRRLVAYSELSVPPERRRAVEQLDTLVLTEHRGHRLGMLVKAANLAQLERRHPGHPYVVTSNAEENRPMLAVNEQLGFVAIGCRGGWKRTLR